MKLINECVNGVIELIEDQIQRVGYGKERRAKIVFLVGGFGASPYLQELLKESLELRSKRLYRPDADKSWTAVARGAVIYGVEKARHKDARYMSAITKSYGIATEGRFDWLIRKGDLVISNEKRHVYSRYFYIASKACVKGKYNFPIYSYIDKDNDDDIPMWWQDGQHGTLNRMNYVITQLTARLRGRTSRRGQMRLL